MAVDPRDELWKAVYDTWYLAAYNEQIAEALVARWQRVDDWTKVLTAITASGSAIAGWALWNEAGFKTLWVVIAGIGAVASIVGSALGTPSRLKDWGDSKREFTVLKLDLETFQYEMRINPEFDIEAFTKRFNDYRARLADAICRIKNDILSTSRFAINCQTALDERLKLRAP
jgi:hypothetical protein